MECRFPVDCHSQGSVEREFPIDALAWTGKAEPTDVQDYFLPDGYVSNTSPDPHMDWEVQDGLTWQPDIYIQAAWTAARTGGHVVDLGCGTGRKLANMGALRTIGFDVPETIQSNRERLPDREWREIDLEAKRPAPNFLATVRGSIVVCSDVIEHMIRPERLLSLLRLTRHEWRYAFMSTPDRALVREPGSLGPPANPAHVREWTSAEFTKLLNSFGLAPEAVTLGRDNTRDGIESSITVLLKGT